MGFICVFRRCGGFCCIDLLGGGAMSISVIVGSFGVAMFLGMLGWGFSRVGSMYSRMLH